VHYLRTLADSRALVAKAHIPHIAESISGQIP
jgi:hypothetical protein